MHAEQHFLLTVSHSGLDPTYCHLSNLEIAAHDIGMYPRNTDADCITEWNKSLNIDRA